MGKFKNWLINNAAIFTVGAFLLAVLNVHSGQLKEVQSELKTDISELRSDIKEIRSDIKEIRTDIKRIESELRADIKKVEYELRGEIKNIYILVTSLISDKQKSEKKNKRDKQAGNHIK